MARGSRDGGGGRICFVLSDVLACAGRALGELRRKRILPVLHLARHLQRRQARVRSRQRCARRGRSRSMERSALAHDITVAGGRMSIRAGGGGNERRRVSWELRRCALRCLVGRRRAIVQHRVEIHDGGCVCRLRCHMPLRARSPRAHCRYHSALAMHSVVYAPYDMWCLILQRLVCIPLSSCDGAAWLGDDRPTRLQIAGVGFARLRPWPNLQQAQRQAPDCMSSSSGDVCVGLYHGPYTRTYNAGGSVWVVCATT